MLLHGFVPTPLSYGLMCPFQLNNNRCVMLWRWCVCRSGSGNSDSFGPSVLPAAAGAHQQQQHASGAIAMQALPVATQAAPQQQQQQVLPASPSAAGVRARPSRLGQQQPQQQQAGTSSGGRAPQFTLGGDDTL